MVSVPHAPIASRRAAAGAFAKSVRQHGIGLTIPQIQQQARRYDEHADLDSQTEEVLWSILETLQSAPR